MLKLYTLAVALTLFSLNALPSQAEAVPSGPFNCATLWAATVGQNIPCEEFTSSGFPAVVGGAEIRIFHYADGWTNERGQLELLGAVSDAARLAADRYGQIWPMPKLYFLLHHEFTQGLYAQANWLPPTSSDSCRIDLFLNIPNDRDVAMQTAAHEVFHCLQAHSLRYPKTQESDAGVQSWSWWVEGTATQLSSVVIPAGHQELHEAQNYRPLLPLYHQPDGYSTVVFWDYLAHQEYFSWSTLGNLMRGQPELSTFASERQAISRYPDIDEIFNRFGTHLVDRDIVNVTQTKYATPEIKFGQPTDFDPAWDHLEQPIVPFTVNTGAIRFPSGIHVRWGLSAGATAQHVRLSFRKRGDSLWMPMIAGLDTGIDADCSQLEGSVYEYVVTSTADRADNVSALMTFRDAQTKECFCKDTAQPLDSCLKGNWVLDDQALSDYYTHAFPMFQRVDISGVMTFKIPGGSNTTPSTRFDSYRTYILEASQGGSRLEQEAIANGTIEVKIFMQKPGEICLRPGTANGTYRQRFNDNPIVDGSLSEAFRPDPSSPEPHWQYTCDVRHLQMTYLAGEGLTLRWEFSKQP